VNTGLKTPVSGVSEGALQHTCHSAVCCSLPAILAHLSLLDRNLSRSPATVNRRSTLPKIFGIQPAAGRSLAASSFGASTNRGLWSGDVVTDPTDQWPHRGGATVWGQRFSPPFNPARIVATTCGGEIVGIICRHFPHQHPSPAAAYKALPAMGNIGKVLPVHRSASVLLPPSSVAERCVNGFSGTSWELFGAHSLSAWDQGLTSRQKSTVRVATPENGSAKEEPMLAIPEKLAFFELLGNRSCQGGMFPCRPHGQLVTPATRLMANISFKPNQEARELNEALAALLPRTIPCAGKTAKGIVRADSLSRRSEPSNSSVADRRYPATVYCGASRSGLHRPGRVKRIARKGATG